MYLKNEITLISALLQNHGLFAKSAMTFDLENPRWPTLVVILDFDNWMQQKLISGWSFLLWFVARDQLLRYSEDLAVPGVLNRASLCRH